MANGNAQNSMSQTIVFSPDLSLGDVFFGSGDHVVWECAGSAIGSIDVPSGKAVLLVVLDVPLVELGCLAALGAGDLQRLDLSANRSRITDHELGFLAHLTELEWLDLNGTAISNGGLASLCGLSGLRTLKLAATGVTDAGLQVLHHLPHLELLNLAGTAITDAGLSNVHACPRLRTVVLAGTQVTDASVTVLTRLRDLRYLNPPAGLTERGRAALQRDLPQCHIGSFV